MISPRIVAANSAGRIIVLMISPKPVTAPSIIGLRIVPEAIEPVAIRIPKRIGATSVIVLTIVATVSRLSS